MAKQGKGTGKIGFLLFFLLFLVFPPLFAIDGVYHNPYGIDCLYTEEATERYPRDPGAGEEVYVKLTTWPIEMGQAAWVTWTISGVPQSDVGAEWKYNDGNNSYWEVGLGSFSQGDSISYTVHANLYGSGEVTSGPFSFTVPGWETVSQVNYYTDNGDHIILELIPDSGGFSPQFSLSFPEEDILRCQLSPKGNGDYATGLSTYSIHETTELINIVTDELWIQIEKDPYRMSVFEEDGTTLLAREYDQLSHRNLAWLTDGVTLAQIQDNFYTPSDEEFFGFGEHYNNFRKRGQVVDTYIYNQYKNQDERTYLAIPFFLNTNGYGLFLNSTYYSRFDLASVDGDRYCFTANTGQSETAMLDYYIFDGTDLKDVVSQFTSVTARPELPPKWAFGLWMSANEWDRQSEVDTALIQTAINDLPASVMVLEQWSDESTFYIFNDAEYTPVTGSNALAYADFTFPSAGRWPDPQGMVEDLHDAGMKVLFWQVPLLKATNEAHTQNDNDRLYMQSAGYAVGNGSGGEYQIPDGKWFAGSLLVDFTSEAATSWWMSKRAYLLETIGADGFKTDGGEMLWGRWNTFSDGRKGDEMRNNYPNEYIRAYNTYARTHNPEAITFSRSGTTGVQKYHTFWSGDQESNFYSFRQAILAGLTAGMSGVPFMGWDLAGFTGDFPTSELYKRSAQMAAFCPIMQFHSEKANPGVSEERSPWNVADRTGDATAAEVFVEYANKRYNLIPYIYSEAKKTADSGIPLMRAMALEYPQDTACYDLTEQYFFGDNLLVAPLANEGETDKSVYLPEGEWIDFIYHAQRPGSRTISYYADTSSLPLFARNGAVFPMNLNADYEFGGTIGNDLGNYTNLVFRIYPYQDSGYDWYDDIGDGSVKSIQVEEAYDYGEILITLPAVSFTSTLQVYTTAPSSVEADGSPLTECTSLAVLKAVSAGWYYDSALSLVFIKLPESASERDIVLSGVNKAPYEGEFATQTNVAVDNDHDGYTGTGFIDQFESLGDAIEFDIYVDEAGTYTLGFRYSAGAAASTRSLLINSDDITDLSLSETADWDTWATASISVSLSAGHNTVSINYDADNSGAINLDSLFIVE